MMAVDTSALLAILKGEPQAHACAARLEAEPGPLLLSAVTLAEALIVAGRRETGQDAMERLIARIDPQIVDVTSASAQRAAAAYAKWGKGVHPAGLNFADCFAYETAKAHGCPLLYVGGDFARTDVASAL